MLNGTIHVVGQCCVQLETGYLKCTVTFLVTDSVYEPLLIGQDIINSFGNWLYRPSRKDLILSNSSVPLVDPIGIPLNLKEYCGFSNPSFANL